MNAKLDPLVVDSLFFTSLIKANLPALDQVLAHDFILIDVMSGSEVTRSSLLAVIGSGQVKFESIEPADNRVRLYKTTAVVTGRTRMKGRLGDAPFVASSRYTHVFVMDKGEWRLVAAQGTADLTEAGTASNLVGAPNAVETADFWNFSPLQRKSIAVQSRPRSFQNERRESLLEPLSSARRRVFPSRVPAGCHHALERKPLMNPWVTCLSLRQVALPPNEAVGPSFPLSFLETIRAHGPTSSFYWIFPPRAGHSTVWKPRC